MDSKSYQLPNYLVLDVTHVACTCFESLNFHILWVHWNSVLIGVSQSYLYEYIEQQNSADTPSAYISFACAHTLLFYYTLPTNHKFRDRIIKNFKKTVSEH